MTTRKFRIASGIIAVGLTVTVILYLSFSGNATDTNGKVNETENIVNPMDQVKPINFEPEVKKKEPVNPLNIFPPVVKLKESEEHKDEKGHKGSEEQEENEESDDENEEEPGREEPEDELVESEEDDLPDVYIDDIEVHITGEETIDQLFPKITESQLAFVYNASISEELKELLDNQTNFDDLKILDKLTEIPKKKGKTLGFRNAGNVCFSAVAVQTLYRIPIIRKIIGNLNVLLEITEKSGKLDKKLMKSFKVLEGINYLFYQLDSEDTKKHCEYYYPMRNIPNLIHEDHELAENLQNKILTEAYKKRPQKYFRAFQGMEPNYRFRSFGSAEKYLEFILSNITAIIPKSQKNILSMEREEIEDESLFLFELSNLKHLITTYYQEDLEEEIDGKRGLKMETLIKSFFNDKTMRDNPLLKYFPDFIPISVQNLPFINEIFAEEEIDFTKYASNENQSTNSKYRFMNMVFIHEDQYEKNQPGGSMNHYIAYICEDDGKCYRYDDDEVKEITKERFEEKVRTARAITYFYERINN